MVPIARTYSASAGRRVWQPVRCEHCQCEFAYEFHIAGTGKGSSAFGLISIEAMGRAIENAETELQYKMEDYHNQRLKGTKIIPCPDCGKLQKSMVRTTNAERQKRLILIVVLAAIILLNPLVVDFYKGMPAPNTPFKWETAYTPTILIPFVVFLLLFFIALIRKQVGIGLLALLALIEALTASILNLPVGISILLGLALAYLMYQNRIAFNTNPAVYADTGTPILRRSEFEALAAKLKAESGIEVPIPKWA